MVAPKASAKGKNPAQAVAGQPGGPARNSAGVPGASPGAGAATPGGAPTAAGGNGGATDIGITENSISLGEVSMMGIAMANVFTAPQVRGNQAAADAVNDAGGVYGRRYKITNCDDGPGDLGRGKACVKKLAEQDKVFAMITSLTWSTAGLHDDLARYKLPLVGAWAYSNTEWTDPFMFPTHMSMIHEATANAIWVRDVHKPKTYGLLCLNSPEMQKSCANVRRVLDATGAKMVHQTNMDINTADLSSEVIAMKVANPEVVVHYVLWPSSLTKWVISASQQGYWPPKGLTGNHLAAEVLGSLWGSWPAGRYWTITTYKLWGTNYMATAKKYAPGNKGLNHHIVQAGYVGITNVLTEALKRIGPDVNRKKLMDVLNQGEWNADADMGQKFIWTEGKRNSSGFGNCHEYMYKYMSDDTIAKEDFSPSGFVPAPEMFEITIPPELCD